MANLCGFAALGSKSGCLRRAWRYEEAWVLLRLNYMHNLCAVVQSVQNGGLLVFADLFGDVFVQCESLSFFIQNVIIHVCVFLAVFIAEKSFF